MSTVTLEVAQRFPDGTVLTAHPRDSQAVSQEKPSGSPAATATVTDGEVTFSGLTEDERYVAFGEVAGEWRKYGFIVNQEADPFKVRGVAVATADQITGLATTAALEAETSARGAADSELQDAIDAIDVGGGGFGTNVLDYGAVGDGSANDTAAIQAAITAAGVGGTLYFPAGTYMIAGTDPAVLDALDKQTWMGDGPNSILKLTVQAGTTKLIRCNTANSKTRFVNLRFEGPASFGAVTDRNYGIQTGNVNDVRIECFNCEFARFGPALAVYQDTSGSVLYIENCLIDGEDIGAGTGGQKQVTGLAPQADCTLIAHNCEFTRLGSANTGGAPGGSNQCHAIYAYQSASILLSDCRFSGQNTGRYVQCYDDPTTPVTPRFWQIDGCTFDQPASNSNNGHVQTNDKRRSIIRSCNFYLPSLSSNAVHVQGAATIEGCLFNGDSANTDYWIQVEPSLGAATTQRVHIVGCTFEDTDSGASGACIYLPTEADDTDLLVDGCYFNCGKDWFVRTYGLTGSKLRFRACVFTLNTGNNGIDVSNASTIDLLDVKGCEFEGGSVGIRLRTGTTVTAFYTRDNYFNGQSSSAIAKEGTVTAESAKDNVGYADV